MLEIVKETKRKIQKKNNMEATLKEGTYAAATRKTQRRSATYVEKLDIYLKTVITAKIS